VIFCCHNPTVPSDDPLVRQLPIHWESLVTVTIGVLLLPVAAYLLARAVSLSSLLDGVVGAVVLLLAFPLLALSAREVFRPPQLRSRTLVLRRMMHRSIRIPLAEISGVGLIYDLGAVRAGWFLRVWTIDGASYGIDSVRTYVRGAKHPELGPPPFKVRRRKRPRLDWKAIAITPAGRATTSIHRQCRAVQGPRGSLSTLAEQCYGPSYGTYLAFWSADGRIGWLGMDEVDELADE
jgi:hypothetical protein